MPDQTADFVLRGAKAIRFVAMAIQHEIDRLEDYLKDQDAYEDDISDASNDLGFYRAILADMRKVA